MIGILSMYAFEGLSDFDASMKSGDYAALIVNASTFYLIVHFVETFVGCKWH